MPRSNFLHQIFYQLCFCLQEFIKVVRSLLAAVSINALTLPMLILLSSKGQGHKDFQKPSKPCHVGIHWTALAEYS